MICQNLLINTNYRCCKNVANKPISSDLPINRCITTLFIPDPWLYHRPKIVYTMVYREHYLYVDYTEVTWLRNLTLKVYSILGL